MPMPPPGMCATSAELPKGDEAVNMFNRVMSDYWSQVSSCEEPGCGAGRPLLQCSLQCTKLRQHERCLTPKLVSLYNRCLLLASACSQPGTLSGLPCPASGQPGKVPHVCQNLSAGGARAPHQGLQRHGGPHSGQHTPSSGSQRTPHCTSCRCSRHCSRHPPSCDSCCKRHPSWGCSCKEHPPGRHPQSRWRREEQGGRGLRVLPVRQPVWQRQPAAPHQAVPSALGQPGERLPCERWLTQGRALLLSRVPCTSCNEHASSELRAGGTSGSARWPSLRELAALKQMAVTLLLSHCSSDAVGMLNTGCRGVVADICQPDYKADAAARFFVQLTYDGCWCSKPTCLQT